MEVPEIDVAELAEAHGDGAVVIDVREPDEYEAVHVPGAQLIPLTTVPDRLDEIPATGPVYIICATGRRSLRAAEFYRMQSREAINVAGGTKAWVEAGNPVATGMDP